MIDKKLIEKVEALMPLARPYFPPDVCTEEGEAMNSIIQLLLAVAREINQQQEPPSPSQTLVERINAFEEARRALQQPINQEQSK